MAADINTFHHLGIIAHDLSVTAARCEHLGFQLTPLSFPEFPLSPGAAPEPVGVANRHAIFANSYLEILGVVDAARWGSVSLQQRGPFDIDRPLRRHEGLHVMHFGTGDLTAVRARLAAEGLEPSPILPFQRTVEAPDGSQQRMRARRLSFAPGLNPEALFQIVQHETPELVLQRRHMAHPNGALTLSEAILCVEDPAGVSDRYSRYAGHPVERREGLHVIELGEARLIVVDRHHLDAVLPGEAPPTLPCLAGFTVTAELGRTTALLRHREIPHRDQDGRLVVSAREAGGCAVVFESPGMRR